MIWRTIKRGSLGLAAIFFFGVIACAGGKGSSESEYMDVKGFKKDDLYLEESMMAELDITRPLGCLGVALKDKHGNTHVKLAGHVVLKNDAKKPKSITKPFLFEKKIYSRERETNAGFLSFLNFSADDSKYIAFQIAQTLASYIDINDVDWDKFRQYSSDLKSNDKIKDFKSVRVFVVQSTALMLLSYSELKEMKLNSDVDIPMYGVSLGGKFYSSTEVEKNVRLVKISPLFDVSFEDMFAGLLDSARYVPKDLEDEIPSQGNLDSDSSDSSSDGESRGVLSRMKSTSSGLLAKIEGKDPEKKSKKRKSRKKSKSLKGEKAPLVDRSKEKVFSVQSVDQGSGSKTPREKQAILARQLSQQINGKVVHSKVGKDELGFEFNFSTKKKAYPSAKSSSDILQYSDSAVYSDRSES